MLRYPLFQKNLNLNENKKQMNTQKKPNKTKENNQNEQTKPKMYYFSSLWKFHITKENKVLNFDCWGFLLAPR